MTTVTKTMQDRVMRRLRQDIKTVERHYGIKVEMPSVSYDLRGTTAGTAQVYSCRINLNAVLLMENGDAFINRTVPHELAHIVDYILHPENFSATRGLTYSAATNRWVRGGKRSIHGPTWKAIMHVLGADPSRCHSYDTGNTRVKRTSSHTWTCNGCGAKMRLGPKRHAKMIAGRTRYWRRGCAHHGGFTYDGDGVTTHVRPTVQPRVVDPTTMPFTEYKLHTKSKLDLCRALFNPEMSRAFVIRRFIQDAGCTPGGANTYYSRIKKEMSE
jgi:SprT protein